MKISSLVAAIILSLSSGAVFAQDQAKAQSAKFEVQASDSVKTILEGRAGQRVKIRLQNGEMIEGKVLKVGEKLVQITELSGLEYFDAAINIDSIAAVIVRTRDSR